MYRYVYMGGHRCRKPTPAEVSKPSLVALPAARPCWHAERGFPRGGEGSSPAQLGFWARDVVSACLNPHPCFFPFRFGALSPEISKVRDARCTKAACAETTSLPHAGLDGLPPPLRARLLRAPGAENLAITSWGPFYKVSYYLGDLKREPNLENFPAGEEGLITAMVVRRS